MQFFAPSIMSRLDIAAVVNGGADWVSESPTLKFAFGNPLAAALMLTAIVAIVLIAVYGYSDVDTKRALRAGLYLYGAIAAVMFVHHYIVMREASNDSQVETYRSVVGNVISSQRDGVFNATPVLSDNARIDNVRSDDTSYDAASPTPDDMNILGGAMVSTHPYGGEQSNGYSISEGLLAINDVKLTVPPRTSAARADAPQTGTGRADAPQTSTGRADAPRSHRRR